MATQEHNKDVLFTRILRLCANVFHVPHAILEKVDVNNNIQIIAQYTEDKKQLLDIDDVVKLSGKYIFEDVLASFNSQGFSQCSNTKILPDKYYTIVKEYNISAYLLKYFIVEDSKTSKPATYVLAYYQYDIEHRWSENERDIVDQTAKFLRLMLNN